MAASFSIMSMRLPLDRLLYVGGKTETNWSHRVAGLSIVSSRWFSSDAAAFPDCISTLSSFQPLPATETDALARTKPDWSATSATRTGSGLAESLLAKNEPVYRLFGLTAIPQSPSLRRPAGLLASALVTSNLALEGNAADGTSFGSTLTFAAAVPLSITNQFRMPVQSDRNVRLRTNSAYNPPS